jgi:hypothetical protein
MATIREQLEAKYGKTQSPVASKMSVRQQLEAKYSAPKPFTYDVVETPEMRKNKIARYQAEAQASQEESDKANSLWGKTKNFGKAVVSNLAPSEVGLGKTITNTFDTIAEKGRYDKSKPVTTTLDRYTQSIETLSATQQQLVRAIREKEARGEDANKLKYLYNENQRELDRLNSEMGAESKIPTTKQVVGQLAGTALDVLTAGTYGKATAGMKTGQLTMPSKTIAATVANHFKSGEQIAKELPDKPLVDILDHTRKQVALSLEQAGLKAEAQKVLATSIDDMASLADLQKTIGNTLNISSIMPSALPKGNAGVVRTASDIAKGAGIGYGYDVTTGLQNGEENPYKPGLGTALGAGIPIVGKFAEKGGQSVRSSFNKEKAIDDLENTYRTLTGGTKSGMKKQNKIDAKVNAMNNAGTTGRAPERVLAEKGIIPEAKGTKLNTFQQAEDLRATVSPLREANRKALAETELGTSMNKLDELEAKAIEYSRTAQNINSGRAKKMAEEIKKEFDILRAEYPTGEIPLTVVDDIKSARWENVFKNKGLVDADVLRKDSEYSIAKALQKHIEQVADNAGSTQVAQLNREIGDIMDAAKYLDDMNGNTLKGGRLLKYITTAIGSSLGQSLPGKIIGAFGGNFVGDMLIANNISNPIKRFILRKVKDKDPEAYLKTIEWLANQKNARANRLLLPPGDKKAIELFDGIQRTPSGAIKETPASVLPAQKNPTTVNPQTGRFQTTYNSQSKSPTNEQTMNAMSNDAIIPIKSTLPKSKTNVKQIISTDATLIQEAKKYKSAEEFMNTQQSYFRGQPEGDSLMTRGGGDGGYGKGLMFTDSPTTARVWHNNVLEFGFKPGSNVRTFKGDYDFKNEVYDWALKTKGDQYRYNVDTNTIINDWATANKVDAVSTPFGGTIFNNDSVITKQQMKKIWEEANKK